MVGVPTNTQKCIASKNIKKKYGYCHPEEYPVQLAKDTVVMYSSSYLACSKIERLES